MSQNSGESPKKQEWEPFDVSRLYEDLPSSRRLNDSRGSLFALGSGAAVVMGGILGYGLLNVMRGGKHAADFFGTRVLAQGGVVLLVGSFAWASTALSRSFYESDPAAQKDTQDKN